MYIVLFCFLTVLGQSWTTSSKRDNSPRPIISLQKLSQSQLDTVHAVPPKSMYMSMYICIYVYMYICIYVYMYICTYVHMYICIYVYMYICIYVYMYI